MVTPLLQPWAASGCAVTWSGITEGVTFPYWPCHSAPALREPLRLSAAYFFSGLSSIADWLWESLLNRPPRGASRLFPVLSIISKTEMTTYIDTIFWGRHTLSFLWDKCPSLQFPGERYEYVYSFFFKKRKKLPTCFPGDYTIFYSPATCEWSSFFTLLLAFGVITGFAF